LKFLKDAWQKAKLATFSNADKLAKHIDENKSDWKKKLTDGADQAKIATEQYTKESAEKIKEQAKSLYINTVYSAQKVDDLEHQVKAQGAMYRELLRERKLQDSIFLGGESLFTLIGAGIVPLDIQQAYEAAFPALSIETTFAEKVSQLESDEQLTGFVSAVKGKLFEMRYVEYLNNEKLPDGYIAELAASSTQAGWDIAILGPNKEVANLLQAKATDSVSYVQEALERYPAIDVVTTDEVYSHLVMTGVSESLSNSGISNIELTEKLESAVLNTDIDMDVLPPIFTLAFIAFTSYKDDSMTLYQKAKSAGSRSGKAYFSYIIGGGIAAITNTWWLGVLGSVTSRYISDSGLQKVAVVETLQKTIINNKLVINRIEVKH
jgi:hypothetical protein